MSWFSIVSDCTLDSSYSEGATRRLSLSIVSLTANISFPLHDELADWVVTAVQFLQPLPRQRLETELVVHGGIHLVESPRPLTHISDISSGARR